MIPEELANVMVDAPNGDNPTYVQAADICEEMATSALFAEFLTLPLYEQI